MDDLNNQEWWHVILSECVRLICRRTFLVRVCFVSCSRRVSWGMTPLVRFHKDLARQGGESSRLVSEFNFRLIVVSHGNNSLYILLRLLTTICLTRRYHICVATAKVWCVYVFTDPTVDKIIKLDHFIMITRQPGELLSG